MCCPPPLCSAYSLRCSLLRNHVGITLREMVFCVDRCALCEGACREHNACPLDHGTRSASRILDRATEQLISECEIRHKQATHVSTRRHEVSTVNRVNALIWKRWCSNEGRRRNVLGHRRWRCVTTSESRVFVHRRWKQRGKLDQCTRPRNTDTRSTALVHKRRCSVQPKKPVLVHKHWNSARPRSSSTSAGGRTRPQALVQRGNQEHCTRTWALLQHAAQEPCTRPLALVQHATQEQCTRQQALMTKETKKEMRVFDPKRWHASKELALAHRSPSTIRDSVFFGEHA